MLIVAMYSEEVDHLIKWSTSFFCAKIQGIS